MIFGIYQLHAWEIFFIGKSLTCDLYQSHLIKNLSSLVYVCFLDYSKAFERVSHSVLLNKLFVCQVPSVVIRMLKFWFTQQSFCVKVGNVTSDVFTVTNGCRQGGILSPILFYIVS